MGIIEELLGISPDGGSGSTELAFLVVGAIIIAAIIRRRLAAHR